METVIVPVLQMRKLRLCGNKKLIPIKENHSALIAFCKVDLKLWKMRNMASVKNFNGQEEKSRGVLFL